MSVILIFLQALILALPVDVCLHSEKEPEEMQFATLRSQDRSKRYSFRRKKREKGYSAQTESNDSEDALMMAALDLEEKRPPSLDFPTAEVIHAPEGHITLHCEQCRTYRWVAEIQTQLIRAPTQKFNSKCIKTCVWARSIQKK